MGIDLFIFTTMDISNPEYWDQRYQEGRTGWDMGQVSPPLKAYFDQLRNKDISILIPGAGNAYEAEYLIQQGFTDVTVLDFAQSLIKMLEKNYAAYLDKGLKLVCQDFFDHEGRYELIVEQTFFCALDPSFRPAYVKKMHELLKPQGKLMGVLFGLDFDFEGPPFGGTKEQYLPLFEPYFNIEVFEECYNSLEPRQGTELFFKLNPKNK